MCIQKQYSANVKLNVKLTYFYLMNVILFCFILQVPLSSSTFPLPLRYGSAHAVKPQPNSCVGQYATLLQLLWQNIANSVIISVSTLHFKGTHM
jgi:hypothetical protein